MKLTITGGAGYVGSALSAHFLATGHHVCVFDKLVYGSEGLLGFAHHPRFRLIAGDVRDTALLSRAFADADAIVHLAAVVGEAACQTDESAAWSINVEGVQSALEAYRRSHARQFIFVSTCSNYGIAADTIATEETALHPLSLYARSKVRAEELALAAPGEVCVFRFGTICGLSARMRFDLLVNDMARAAATGKPIRVFAPEAWRPMLDITDAARAVETRLMSRIPNSRLFNAVSENVRKRDLVEIVRRRFTGAPVEISETESDNRDYRVSGERIRSELGFEPKVTVEDSLLAVAKVVSSGAFRDPFWPGHSAVPLEQGKFAQSSIGVVETDRIAAVH